MNKKLFLAGLLFLQGCSLVGPRYKKPQVNTPDAFTNSPDSHPADLACWWESFNDPHLTELIHKALDANYDLKTAIEKIEEARCTYNIQTAALFPEIDAFGFILRTRFSKSLPLFAGLPENPTNLLGLGAATNWELDFWGRLRKSRAAAYAEYQAQIEAARDVYIMLVADVAQLYIELASLHKKIAIKKEQVALDESITVLVGDLFAAGFADRIVHEAQKQVYDESRDALLLLHKMRMQTQNNLAVLLGEAPQGFACECADEVPVSSAQLTTGLPSELLRRRPDIRKAEQKLMAATAMVGAAVAEFFPKFSLLGFVSTISNAFCRWFNGNSLAWTVGPAFTWPVITFGRISYTVKAKKSAQRQAMYSYCNSVVSAFRDVENALINYLTQQQSLKISQQKLASARIETELIHERFTAGLIDRMSYLVSKKQMLEVLTQVTDIQKQQSLALVIVYKALGGGWEHA